jgi:enamine deaminase RidA (YjgF/YER057c/UK114 family)
LNIGKDIDMVEEKLMKIGLKLPKAPEKGGVYASVKKIEEKIFYFSGCGPLMGDEGIRGKLGVELDIEEGQAAARATMLNVLALLKQTFGDLDRIESFVKILVFVACDKDFYDQPQVANGATQLLVDLFGEECGAPTRSAIGVIALPGNVPVEIEGIVRIK